ncbi:SCP160 protein [Heliocybe sulcata]|uniref:SCP160 protein n=1 Tax=Heliocybe sulcata TaxID=5364 RepID=A0A5C3N959_9AGAM|nr:SCP160 protein [Heliocybe sulcata]
MECRVGNALDLHSFTSSCRTLPLLDYIPSSLRRHELEGAPDPFPSLGDPTVAPARSSGPTNGDLNAVSQEAFPSLAPSPAPAKQPTTSAWGAAAGPRIKSTTISDSITLAAIDLSSGGKDGKSTTLGEVMKQVMSKFKVKIEASTNQRTKQTTFFLKSESQKELDKAKRSLTSLLSPVISAVINAPASTIPTVIGPKGATLKQIRDQTNVKIDIPRKDVAPADGHANGHAAVAGEEDEEPTIPITVTGSQPLVAEAQAMLNAIIATKTSKTTQRVRDIPGHILPFVKARRTFFEQAAQGGEVNMNLNAPAREITVSGDREAVVRVVEAIKSTIESFSGNLTSFKIQLQKRQHRLLAGKAIDEIIAKSKCAVVIPPPEDPSEEVTVWGLGADLASGMQAVMEKANSQYIHEFPLPGPITLSRQILTYMTRVGYPKTLSTAHPGVSVYTTPEALVPKASVLHVELIGEKPAVDGAVRQVSELMGKLIGATKDIQIDWLLHRVIQGKNAKKFKAFQDSHNVRVFFPPETAEQSTVLLVYDPTSPNASPNPVEKGKHLEDVEAELLKMVREAADVKSKAISVEKRWHEAVVGQGGTTLNAIIGEDKTLSIKIGADAGDASTEDIILIRGASTDVERAAKEILQIVEDAKNDEIVSSYSVEFDIDREYVGRIVGSGGAGVNRIRDQLGVKVDFNDEEGEKEKEGKKKKAAHSKAKVKITGRKENVEEAKKRILSQVERLADETSEVLKIPHQYHSGLIGQGGKYVIRLEEKYAVKITFPRDMGEGEGRTRENLKADEVLVKGGRKGVANAKSELMDAVEFEKENNNVINFTVPTRAVARILGRGGASINDIKDSTNTQIDIDKGADETTSITCRGTKKGIAAAKAAILEIANQVNEETTIVLNIEPKYHRSIIGAGGQGLRDLIARCGGPTDSRQQAGLVRFLSSPRQGEAVSDEVQLRGDKTVVKKLQAELEKIVSGLRDRVVLGIEIPAPQHRALIGRGGQHLNDLQNRTGAQVQFPGSRSYHQTGEPDNAAELTSVDAANLVKVIGSRAACEKAIEELKASAKPPPSVESAQAVVNVPLKYHHFVTQQGQLFRTLRSFGVHVDQSRAPTKPGVPPQPPQDGAVTARIDDEADAAATEAQWQVVSNYEDAEDGDSEWTLRARDQAGLEKAQKTIEDAIEHAKEMTHVGFLTLPDRSSFPRIVGAKGANVARLRAESGADIIVSRENTTVVIIGPVGSEHAIETAKEAILRIAAPRSRRRED